MNDGLTDAVERAEPLDQEMNVRILSGVLAQITKAYPAVDARRDLQIHVTYANVTRFCKLLFCVIWIAAMDTPAAKACRLLRRQAVARSHELEAAGVSRTTLAKLVERGTVRRVARGVYSLPDASPDVGHDLARAACQVPGGVVCLLSALRFHRLTTQNPFEVWVAIPPNAWRPAGGGVPIRFIHVARSHLADGVEHHRIEGTKVAITTPAKTVADCFKFRNRIGTDVAIEALREFVQRHPGKIDSLLRHAKIDRVERVIRPYLESLA